MAIMVCLHSLSNDEEKRLLRGQLRVQRYLRPLVILEDKDAFSVVSEMI